MVYEKIVAVYDTAAKADAAVETLKSAGYNDSQISVIKNEAEYEGHATKPGFWSRLFGSGVEKRDADVFGHSMKQNGVAVTVHVPEEEAGEVLDLLESHEPVDLDDRERSLRSNVPSANAPADYSEDAAARAAERRAERADGVPSDVAAGRLSEVAEERQSDLQSEEQEEAAEARRAEVGAAPLTDAAAQRRADLDAAGGRSAERARDDRAQNETIRLAEEQLNVGKERIQTGITRVRRFVTERPVEANVTLHEEHAEVVRRAAADPSYLNDVDWADKTIEITETAERPVVEKTTRVVEEVAIRKDGSDRVETVHDTVRRQNVEVEKVPGSEEASRSVRK